jgi:hypothetical protein
MVEAAGIEPHGSTLPNLVMVRDFCSQSNTLGPLPPFHLLPYNPPHSPGFDPFRGGILETAGNARRVPPPPGTLP